jgi:hypothetical protein
MPVLSYVHHLFDVNQCHAYIHTLRWKDRPLQCPRCQSQDVDPWGMYHYRPGCKRYWTSGSTGTEISGRDLIGKRPLHRLLTFPYRDFSEYACGFTDATP